MKRHDLIQNNKSLVKVNIQMIQSRRQWMTISLQQITWARQIDQRRTEKLVSRKRYPYKLVKKLKNKRQYSTKIKSKWVNLRWFWRVCVILTYLRTKWRWLKHENNSFRLQISRFQRNILSRKNLTKLRINNVRWNINLNRVRRWLKPSTKNSCSKTKLHNT